MNEDLLYTKDDLTPLGDNQPNKKESVFWETVKMLLIAAAIIVPFRLFIIQPFIVKGESMEVNFHGGDYLLIDEITHRFKPYERGEVIVFKLDGRLGEFFIKRVIGLPGETVDIKDGKITITNASHPNGFSLGESDYLDGSVHTGGNVHVTLGSDELFVLGDNRPRSSDSRVWGTLPIKNIVGRAWVRVYPFDKFSVIPIGSIVQKI